MPLTTVHIADVCVESDVERASDMKIDLEAAAHALETEDFYIISDVLDQGTSTAIRECVLA
jgi:hypothetical protein